MNNCQSCKSAVSEMAEVIRSPEAADAMRAFVAGRCEGDASAYAVCNKGWLEHMAGRAVQAVGELFETKAGSICIKNFHVCGEKDEN